MKDILLPLAIVGVMLAGTRPALEAQTANKEQGATQMNVRVGQKTFTATLEENATVAAVRAMLPLTLELDELNGNEKVAHLANDLPTADSNPESIHTGDLMIWSSRSLVLFYQTFPTSYHYTRLGRINDVAGLSAALGSGKVAITFELKQESKKSDQSEK